MRIALSDSVILNLCGNDYVSDVHQNHYRYDTGVFFLVVLRHF